MKAVSPLCLEPRALLWLLEVEEAERAAAPSSWVWTVWLLSGFLVSFRCTAPYPPASQPASHSVEFESGRCDVL